MATTCQWADAEECRMARERSVAGESDIITPCLTHDTDYVRVEASVLGEYVIEPMGATCRVWRIVGDTLEHVEG